MDTIRNSEGIVGPALASEAEGMQGQGQCFLKENYFKINNSLNVLNTYVFKMIFIKILKMQSPVRFRTASQDVERGAESGSARTIGELPPKKFSPVFPPDPTSEIGKIWKHYEFPRFSDPVLPVLQWGNAGA